MGTNANPLHVPLALIAGAQCKHGSERYQHYSQPAPKRSTVPPAGRKTAAKSRKPTVHHLHPPVPRAHSPQTPPGMEAPPLQAAPMLTTFSLKKLLLVVDESIRSTAWAE